MERSLAVADARKWFKGLARRWAAVVDRPVIDTGVCGERELRNYRKESRIDEGEASDGRSRSERLENGFKHLRDHRQRSHNARESILNG